MAVSRETLQFQQNLRKTALGIRFAKNIYTNPTGISPAQIAAVMTALGLTIPKDVVMTADIAQVMVSGQALSNSIEAGDDLANTANPANAAVHSLTAVLQANGMMDDGTAQTVDAVASVAFIICSCGTDVAAWISLACDLASIANSKQGNADVMAAKDLQQKVKKLIMPQFDAVGRTFKDFQEKKIGIFGLITEIAVKAPNLWPQAIQDNSILRASFPDLKFIPTVTQQVTGKGSDEIWGEYPWGGRYVVARWSAEKSVKLQGVGGGIGGNKEAATAFMWKYLIEPWVMVYRFINSQVVGNGHSSILSTALLSLMVGGGTEISDTIDYASLLQAGRLTPNDLNEKTCLNSIVQAAIDADAKDISRTYSETGISTGYENPALRGYYNSKIKGFKWVQQLQAAENIDDFLSVPLFYSALKNFFTFPAMPFESVVTANGKFTGRAWRQLNNFISVIHLVDQFRNDPYLQHTAFATQAAAFIPTVSDFETQFQNLQYKAVMRCVNYAAKNQISFFTGIPITKLNKTALPSGAAVWRGS